MTSQPTTERKKPKFRTGQVVAVRGAYVGAGTYFRISGVRPRAKEPGFEYCRRFDDWVVEFALRPLTKREIG